MLTEEKRAYQYRLLSQLQLYMDNGATSSSIRVGFPLISSFKRSGLDRPAKFTKHRLLPGLDCVCHDELM